MPIRIGFVGTGGIANTHFDALSQLEEAQLVAFCDIDSARAERAARGSADALIPTGARCWTLNR
jgi:myo-inositol 2-dehydrogenase/D-chiro-inositol 1-dehydrogenase